MDQRAAGPDLAPAAHLDRELDLWHAVETGTAAASLRLWETVRPVVVVGRSTRLTDYPAHVDLDACRTDDVEVLRRSSGGGAVVLGPGCLNYAIAVSLVSHPALLEVAASFRVILGWIAAALDVSELSLAGPADLAWRGRKVSGNAQRRGRHAVLHHGTLLYDFDPGLAARYLKEPDRQPAYRAARSHAAFLGNLPLSGDEVRARLTAGLVCAGTVHMHNGADVRPAAVRPEGGPRA